MGIPYRFDPLGTLGTVATGPGILTGPVYVGQLDGLTSSDTNRIKTVSTFEQVAPVGAAYGRLFQLYQASYGRYFAIGAVTSYEWQVENNADIDVGTAWFTATGGVDTLEISHEKIVFNGDVLAETHGVTNKNTNLNVSFGSSSGYPAIRWHSFEFYVDGLLTHRFEPVSTGGAVGMKDLLTGKIYLP